MTERIVRCSCPKKGVVGRMIDDVWLEVVQWKAHRRTGERSADAERGAPREVRLNVNIDDYRPDDYGAAFMTPGPPQKAWLDRQPSERPIRESGAVCSQCRTEHDLDLVVNLARAARRDDRRTVRVPPPRPSMR